jgi:hypothetical protein
MQPFLDINEFIENTIGQYKKFNTKVWTPGTEKIDAFSQFEGNDMTWFVPPASLITRILNKLREGRIKEILMMVHVSHSSFRTC